MVGAMVETWALSSMVLFGCSTDYGSELGVERLPVY